MSRTDRSNSQRRNDLSIEERKRRLEKELKAIEKIEAEDKLKKQKDEFSRDDLLEHLDKLGYKTLEFQRIENLTMVYTGEMRMTSKIGGTKKETRFSFGTTQSHTVPSEQHCYEITCLIPVDAKTCEEKFINVANNKYREDMVVFKYLRTEQTSFVYAAC
jgi:hypothetical protein